MVRCLPFQSDWLYSSQPSVGFSIPAVLFEHPPNLDVNKMRGIALSRWDLSPVLNALNCLHATTEICSLA